MNCAEVQDQLLALAEESLEEAQRRPLETHLLECRFCQSQLSSIRNLIAALSEARDLTPAPQPRSMIIGATSSDVPDLRTLKLPQGTILGDYEIADELGRGGMGAVFRARQRSLNRWVALKVLLPSLSDRPSSVQRFHAEARTAARLRHPHIVPIYAWGCDEGLLHYAMELIEGASMSRIIAQEKMRRIDEPKTRTIESFRRFAAQLADVADALEYAHERGVIHRDIKPHNLLRSLDGRLFVTDFGVAKALDDVRLTQTGEWVGTPLYMAPEQIAGDKPIVDHRCDIWALGVTLYEGLTGRPPFYGRNREQIISSIRHQEPEPPSQVCADVPDRFDVICQTALKKEPAERYSTAAQFAKDLRSFSLGQAETPSKPPGRFPLWKQLKRAWSLGRNPAPDKTDREARIIRQAYEILVFDDYHQTVQAESLLDSVAASQFANPEYHLAWAMSRMVPDPGESLYHLERVLRTDPTHRTALYLKAWALRDRMLNRSQEALKRADELPGPLSPDQHFLRGQAVLRVGGPRAEEEAIEGYRRAIQGRKPQVYPQALLHLGRALNHWTFHHRTLERFEEAERCLQTVANLREDQAYPYYLLSIAYRLAFEIANDSRDPQHAEKWRRSSLEAARRAQNLEPDNALGRMAEAELWMAAHDPVQAGRQYDRAMQLATDSGHSARLADILQYRWRLHYWAGRLEAALADLDQYVGLLSPQSGQRFWFSGMLRPLLFSRLNRPHEALSDIRRTQRESLQRPAEIWTCFAGLVLIGESDKARELLDRKAAELDWPQCVFPYESERWNRALHRFLTGALNWDKLVAMISEDSGDSSWLMAEALFFDGIRAWMEGELGVAARKWEACVRTYDYERYSYLARSILGGLRQGDP